MKKLLLLIMLFLSISAFSQEKHDVYIQVGVFVKSSTKYVASIDFGDGVPEAHIADVDGKKKNLYIFI